MKAKKITSENTKILGKKRYHRNMILSPHFSVAYIFFIHSTNKMLPSQAQKCEKQRIAICFVSQSCVGSFREYKFYSQSYAFVWLQLMAHTLKWEENLPQNVNQGLEFSFHKWRINVPRSLEEIEKYNFRLLFIPISFGNFKPLTPLKDNIFWKLT